MWFNFLVFVVCIFGVQSTVVDLSHKGLKKETFFVNLQRQLNLHEVTNLILKGNQFDSFLDCSTNLDHLKSLDLAENHLQRFFFLCKDEYNLEYLNVSHNHLEYIDDFAFNNRTSKLKLLDLSWNRLSVINETMIEHMKILEYLSIAHNPVNDIHESAFINQQNLVHLDMSNVSASFIPTSLLKPLTKLSFLNISFNPIETLPFLPALLTELDISGTNILFISEISLPHLSRFHLNHMPNVTEVVLNDFENITMLEVLSFENCKMLTEFRIWPPNSRLLPHLRYLSLKGSALETLDENLRPILQRTAEVDLQNNPWHCDCRMQWVNRLNISNDLSREIRCKTPEEHASKLLSAIPNRELICVEILSSAYLAIWASISIIILALTLAGIYLLWRSPLRQWILPKRGGDTVSYKNVKESSNDLIRILVTDDHAED